MSSESPADAAGIARRQFTTARRGYDTKAVRAYLEELATSVAGLQRQVDEAAARAQAAEERAAKAEQLDENRLVELVGEETARVLDSARSAASDIRTKAQEAAARLVAEGHDEARAVVAAAEADGEARKQEIVAETAALRQHAQGELDRRRAEGEAAAAEVVAAAEEEAAAIRATAVHDGEQVVERARSEARHLVAEALAVREKVLGDLARRRRVAREQVERLHAARERLLAAYATVRRTADEATAELTVALPAARVASDQAARRINEEPEPSVEDVEAELSTARMAGLVDADTGAEIDVDVPALAAQLGVDASEHLDVPDAASWVEPEPEPAPAPASLSSPASSSSPAPPPPPPPPPPPGAEAPRLHVVPDLDIPADDLVDGDGDGPIPSPEPQPDAEPDTAAEPQTGPEPAPLPEPAPVPEPDVAAEPEPEPQAAAGAGPQPDADQDPGPPPAPDAEAAVTAEPEADAAPGAEEEPATGPDDELGLLGPVDSPEAAFPLDEAVAPRPAVVDGIEPARNGSAPPTTRPRPSLDELFARVRDAQAAPADAPAPTPAATATVPSEAPAEVAPGPAPESESEGESEGEPPARAGRRSSWPSAVERAAARVSAARGPDAVDEVGDAGVLRRRDEALTGIEALLSRRLKRVLADEENDVLDTLRRGVPDSVDEALPLPPDHLAAYSQVAVPPLDAAAGEGRKLVTGTSTGGRAGRSEALAAQLGAALVEPLRARVTALVGEGGDPEEVSSRLRALYREWKGQRIGVAVRHYAAAAYATGALDGAAKGAELRWVVDRTGEPCPDADDNALAGAVRKGELFPTGDGCPPAHDGCRCLVVPANGVSPADDEDTRPGA